MTKPFATLCQPWDWDWVTQGPRKGHPRATQASRKGHPSVDLRFGLCFQQKWEKGRVGVWLRDAGRGMQKRLPKSPKLPKIAGIKTQSLPRMNTDYRGL